MSFFGGIGNFLAGVGRQVNPFDNGATFANPHPQQRPQQRPQARVNVQQLANALQVHAANNPVLQAPHPTPPPPPLAVHVAPPQMLHMGNQTFAQSPNAHVQADNTLQLNRLLHPSMARQVETGLQQKLQVPLAAAAQVHEMGQQFITRPAAEFAGALQGKQATYHPNTPLEHFVFGQQPVQNLQKNIGNNYATHPNLPTPLRIGLAGLDAAGQVANVLPDVGLATKGGKAAIKAAPEELKTLVPRTALNDQLTLQDYSNHLAGGKQLPPKALSDTIAKSRQIAAKHGVDISQGSQLDQLNGVNSVLDNLSQQNRLLGQVGAVGKNVDMKALQKELGIGQDNAPAYKGPNLNEGAFTAADQKLVGDSMTREAKQITPEDRQFAQITNISPARARTIRIRPSYPNQREAMVGKALEGKTPAELPPTPQVASGDLQPMEHVPTLNKLFSNKINAIRKIGTPNAHALADTIQQADTTSQALRAHYMSQIPTVQKLNKSETAQMFDVVEKKVAQKNSSPKVVQAAKEWQKLTPQIAKNAFKQGALIGERKNYIPHSYPEGFWTKRSGSQYDSAIQHLMDNNKVDHEQAVRLFQNLANQSKTKPDWFANFENARLTKLPGYSKDQGTLYKYVEGAANRTAQAQHLGLDNEIANKYLQNIRMEGGDMVTAKKALENYLNSADKGAGSKALRGVRGVFGTARLGTAAISHAGQTSNVAVDTGIARTLKSWGSYLTRNPEHQDFIAKTGVINPQVLHGYQDQFTSVKGAMSKVTAPGLNQVMKVNRSVTALAYRNYGNALAKAGKEAELRKLGVTGKIDKALTPEQEIQAARGGVNRTMFNPSRATTPTYAETPLGKVVGQYRTAYAYKQTGFIYDRILKEAKAGNLKPLARYLTLSAGVGAGTIQIKKMISGSKEGIGGKALDVAAALGGLPGEVAAELARYGTRGGIKGLGAIAGAVAPLAGEAANAYDVGTQALHGKPAAAERYALGLIPIPGVGKRLSNRFVPAKNAPSATSKTAPNNTTTTLGPNGKTVKMTNRELTANNPDELIRWQSMTDKARANVQSVNPDKFIRDQQMKIQQDLSQGKTTQAFKDSKTVAQTQIYRNFDRNTVQAYGLNSTDFKAFLNQATPDQVNQLQSLDQQLLAKGLVAKTKFPKAKTGVRSSRTASGSSSSAGTAKVATLKLRLPPKPKGVKIGKLPTTPKFRLTKLKAPKLAKPRKSSIKLA